jgi:hypothetical protein
MLSEEQLIQNYEKYKKLLCASTYNTANEIENLFDHFGDRLVLCPASSKQQLHSAFPGGLIDHSLRVLKNSLRLIKVAPDVFSDIPEESVIFTSLVHDLGKLGDLDNERYLMQENDYYRKRGNVYELNTSLAPIHETSLFILQHFGVKLSHQEWQAILSIDNQTLNDSKYDLKETSLALLINQADRLSCYQEKIQQNNATNLG